MENPQDCSKKMKLPVGVLKKLQGTFRELKAIEKMKSTVYEVETQELIQEP